MDGLLEPSTNKMLIRVGRGWNRSTTGEGFPSPAQPSAYSASFLRVKGEAGPVPCRESSRGAFGPRAITRQTLSKAPLQLFYRVGGRIINYAVASLSVTGPRCLGPGTVRSFLTVVMVRSGGPQGIFGVAPPPGMESMSCHGSETIPSLRRPNYRSHGTMCGVNAN